MITFSVLVIPARKLKTCTPPPPSVKAHPAKPVFQHALETVIHGIRSIQLQPTLEVSFETFDFAGS